MKAAYLESFGSTEVLKYGDLPEPDYAPGMAKVQVLFSALNHLDLWIRKGLPGNKLPLPHILGSDGAGVILRSSGKFRPGDKVIIHPGLSCGKCQHCTDGLESLCASYRILGEQVSGVNAEQVVVPEENLFLIPAGLSMAEAASIPLVFTTAWEMLIRKAQITNQSTVLVHAAGSGVSLAGIQIAKNVGARVIATSRTAAKLELAKKFGADETIETSTNNFLAVIRKQFPKGVDVILDHVGQSFWDSNIKLLKNGGCLVTCGATSGFQATTDLRHLFFRQLRLLGSTMGSKRDFPSILECFAQGKYRPFVDKTFPLASIPLAHRYLEEANQSGKVLLSH